MKILLLSNPEDKHTSSYYHSGELNEDELTGSWEKKGKNLTAAAITGLFVIGAIYFNVQSILISIFTIAYQAFYDIVLPPDLIEMLDTLSSELKAPIILGLIISQYLFMMAPSFLVVKKWHTNKIKNH